jgi:hypothetical protein
MRALFLTGGFAGFFLCAVAGLLAGRAPDLILRDAAIGCLAGALLVRWFWRVLLSGFRETLTVRRRAAEEAAAQENARPAKNNPPQKPAPVTSPSAATLPPRSLPLVSPKPAIR